ncbi:MAG TPA: twin-arginine translocation pathway signal protein [Candidatus Aminicenantes bacterium]|nr:twin-arginine translocation pathway signal protein [Candidatus Aminicenantes bacterium]
MDKRDDEINIFNETVSRRDFIKRAIGRSAVVALLLTPGFSIFNGCSSMPLKAMGGWNGPSSEVEDIRIILLSYAILAPNPHNKQSWIIELKDPFRFDLYVDQERLLPETDPPARQIHIGQGTFLENLDLAARSNGYRTNIAYFPRGMYSNNIVENKPVASIELVKEPGIDTDPLFDEILRRQSNKREYEDKPLLQEQIEGLKKAYDTGTYPLTITTDPIERKKLTEFLVEAMRIEVSKESTHAETIEMFRFNDEEMEKYRDGFGVAQSGITGFNKFMTETFFLKRDKALPADSSFAKGAVKLTEKQAASAAAFAWITSRTNTRLDQVMVGRAYERINLMATALGLSQHPISQVLQEYPEMASLQKELKQYLRIPDGHTVQMLFRLGYADPVINAPRRQVRDFIKT